MIFLRNISWIFGANIIVSLTKWLTLIVIARVLTPEDVGVYSLAFAVSAPLTLFANMKLRSLYVTDDNEGFKGYIYSRNLLSVFSLIILFMVSIFIYPEYIYIVLLVGLIKIMDLQSDLYYAIPHKKSNMKFIGQLMIWKHTLVIVIFFGVILITKSLALSLLTQLILQIMFFILIEKKNIALKYKIKNENINSDIVKKILLLGLPLGFVQMIFSFNVSYSRYLLEYFESAAILGYYSAIAYILTIGTLLMNAISQNFLPVLSNKVKERNYEIFKKYVFIYFPSFYTVISILIIGFFILFGETFLLIIYGQEYVEYIDILILMSIALAINFFSSSFDTALLAMRYISIQPKIATFVLIINLFLGYYFVKLYGIYGGAYSIIIINFIQLVFRIIFVAYKLKVIQK